MAENKEVFVLTQMSEFTPSNKIYDKTDIIALQDGNNVRIDSEVLSQQIINKINPKFVERKEKGQPNGVATLDENGKVPSVQLPPLDFTVNEIPIDKQTPTPTQNGVFIPTQIGVYPNFGGLEYTQQEFDNNDDVRFIFIDGRFEKQVKSFGVEGEIKSYDVRAIGGKEVYDYTLRDIKTIAELRTIVGEENQTIRLLGYYEAGDKPPLLYKWVEEVGEDDGGSVIVVGDGYWSALFMECIRPEDFGAKGNGSSDDFIPTNKALTLCLKYKKTLKFSPKTYFIGSTLHTNSSYSYYTDIGITIEGSGRSTILQGNGMKSLGSEDYAKKSILSIHSSNHTIKDIYIRDSEIGIFLGQSPFDSLEKGSHASINLLENIYIKNVGVGIMFKNGAGCYYNKINNFHIAEVQVGIFLDEGYKHTIFNNNRNEFSNGRVTRAHVGTYLKNGDGNTFTSVFYEAITGQKDITGDKPTYVVEVDEPFAIVNVGSNNKYIGYSIESEGGMLYNGGYQNHYIAATMPSDLSANNKRIILKTKPQVYLGGSIVIGNMTMAPNVNSLGEVEHGISINGGVIQDSGYRRRNINASECINIAEQIHTSSSVIVQSLSRNLTISCVARFSVNEVNVDKDINFKIPLVGTNKVSKQYTYNINKRGYKVTQAEISNDVSINSEYTDVYMCTEEEAQTKGYYYLKIQKHSKNWKTSNSNAVRFSVQILID